MTCASLFCPPRHYSGFAFFELSPGLSRGTAPLRMQPGFPYVERSGGGSAWRRDLQHVDSGPAPLESVPGHRARAEGGDCERDSRCVR